VGDIVLVQGENDIQVTVFDSADNSAATALTVRRLSGLSGVAIIAGGRNSSGSLQGNINYVTDRAYRVFQAAGIGADDIYYLSPGPRDADGDGTSDVRATTTPANLHTALQWAAARLSAGVPFYLFLMDHGNVELFCAEGCSGGHQITSRQLDTWLDELESSSGCDQVNVIIDACHSGSLLDKHGDHRDSIAKDGRVVITSTDRTHNAYASAQGALFSDAFFSAVAGSRDLLASFNHARAAVQAASDDQTPWLDDNGDGLHNPADGDHAEQRYVARYFGAILPEILAAAVEVQGQVGQIEATVATGAEPLTSVWAAVYAPSFQAPDHTTLDLGVPLVELEPDPEQAGEYAATYNGFIEQGAYRLVIYAEDEAGNQAAPRVVYSGGTSAYLPLVWKGR
jgi:hypothetical protein